MLLELSSQYKDYDFTNNQCDWKRGVATKMRLYNKKSKQQIFRKLIRKTLKLLKKIVTLPSTKKS